MKKLKKILLPLVTAILVIAISIGATLAYLTDEEAAENVMTIGKVDIDLLEYERVGVDTSDGDAVVQEFRDNKPLLPAVIEKGFDYTPGDTYVDWTQDAVKWQQQNDDDGYTSPIWDPTKINNEVDKMVFVKNTGDYGAYVRIYFAFEAGNFDTFNEFREMIHLNLNETGDWKWEWIPFLATNDEGGKYFIANATYKNELLPDDFTDITLSQIALDSSATNEQVEAFGDTYEVFVNAQGIQSAGFKDPDTALDEGFGDDIPFEDLTLVTGTDLKTALHNLNGNKSTPITSKVATVTFGLNETYPNIVKDNVGTFTSVEQDAMVYTYYVPNATNAANYDVYVLADDTIYTPKISEGLFKNMTSLTTVDTTNMDVSRTENMKAMFMGCKALTSLDVSKWDVSKVKLMNTTFTYCYGLKELDVSGWNVSNVTTMSSMFYDCTALTSLDVTNWDVKNVTDMTMLFYKCQQLNDLNVSNWKVDKVTTMRYMFYWCKALESLTLNSWNVSNVTTFERMFSACNGLTSLNISGWNTASATNMAYMFFECEKLETIDVSGFDLDGVTTIKGMFEKCFAVQELNVQNWNVSSVNDISLVFRKCNAVVTLDLSGWVTSNVTSATAMFKESENLKTIYVGNGWDISQILETNIDTDDEKSSRGMFYGCSSLVGGNGTTLAKIDAIEGIKDEDVVNKTYARVDTAENPGYLTHIDDKPAESEQNQ